MEITNEKNIIFNKYKDILANLFKQTFNNKLKYLEKRTENHLSLISSTKDNTNKITSLVSNMNKQIAAKIKKEKEKKNPIKKKTKSFALRNNSPKSSIVSKVTTFKTPKSSYKKKMKTIEANPTANSKKKQLTMKHRFTTSSKKTIKTFVKKSSSNFLINKSRKKISDLSIKYNTNTNSFFDNINDKKRMNLRYSITNTKIENKKTSIRKSIISLCKHNLTESNISNGNIRMSNIEHTIKSKTKTKAIINRTFDNNKNNKNNKSKLIKKNSFTSSHYTNRTKKVNNKTEKLRRSKTISFTSYKNIENKEKNIEKIKKYENKNKNKNENKNHIKSMESNIQKDDPVFHPDDSLLIIPITDIDFLKNGFSCSTVLSRGKNIIEFFNGKDEKNIHKIFEFLSIEDLTKLKATSRFFNKNIINYFLKNLNETKKKLENIKNAIIHVQKPKTFKNFIFSKGAEKSIELLNEKIINKFFEESNPPKKDILFIYQIFFQLINNPIKDLYNNKKKFWEKCRLYFLNEGKGKIGKLLKDLIIHNKINISENNLYKLYELVKNKLYIIIPSYFNRVCSTTVLMTFYIKDILNYLGISNDKENIEQNGYWTYSYIVNAIDKKINILLEYK